MQIGRSIKPHTATCPKLQYGISITSPIPACTYDIHPTSLGESGKSHVSVEEAGFFFYCRSRLVLVQ